MCVCVFSVPGGTILQEAAVISSILSEQPTAQTTTTWDRSFRSLSGNIPESVTKSNIVQQKNLNFYLMEDSGFNTS